MRICAQSIKIIDAFSIHVFSRKQTGKHDNKYIKVIKNGTVFAKYLLETQRWQDLSKDVPKSVIAWVEDNRMNILNKINTLD